MKNMSKTNSAVTKRARCTNFSLSEENLLVALAVKHSSVLECKKSDHDVWEAKNLAWKQIQDNFIAATGNNRDIQNLKDKYENLKRKTKKIEADRKKDMFLTGGGANTRCTVAPSATHDVLLGILGTSAVGLHNPFDGDKPGKPLVTPDDQSTEKNIVPVNNLECQIDLDDMSNMEYIDVHVLMESEPDEMNESIIQVKKKSNVEDKDLSVRPMWAKWNPETLKTQKSAELKTPYKKNIKTTLGESVKIYSQEKIELITQQKKYFEDENRRAQEKHDADELRAKEKHEWERIQHKLKMEKLQHEINNFKKSKYRLCFCIRRT